MVWAIGLLALTTVAVAAWWASGIGDSSLGGWFMGAEALPGGLIVVLMALRVVRAGRLDARIRRAWSIIAVTLVLYGLSVVVRLIGGYVPSGGLLETLSAALKVACYPLISVGFSFMPRPGRTRYDLSLFSLDVTIAAASAAILLWHFSIFPTAQTAHKDAADAVAAAFFPVYDAALVFSIAALVVRGLSKSTRTAMSIAAFAIGAIFLGDLVVSLGTLDGTYGPGGLSSFFFSIAWVSLAVAAYAQWRIEDREEPARGLVDYAHSSFPWLPYAAVAVAFVAPAIRDWSDIDMLRQHVPATGFLIALVVARLAVTSRHDASLNAAERERLAAAVDQAAESMLTTDRSGDVTYVNPAFTRITGYTAEEAVGRNADFLEDPGHPKQAEIRATLERGEPWEGRLFQRRKDGAAVELDMAIAALRDSTGVMVGSVAVSRDISRERALEAQLVQAQRMEAIGRLAGGVAHDFNNILTAIGGFSQLVAAELGPEHPVAPDIDQIRHAADRAAALTRSLLIFSRRQVTQSRVIDVNDVLAGLTPMLGRLIGEDVQLIVRVDPRLGMTMADSAQIEQVILNLTVNARDAMPAGGTITISTANVDLDGDAAQDHVAAAEGKYIVLVVSDTGTGMTPEVIEHAFEPFFTTKERGKGTGLGLSTAFGIVQAGGGFIRVESELNAGSVFSVYLPRLDGAARPTETAASADQPQGGLEHILVAEDEDAVRNFVRRVLAGAGYQVMAAASGEEAVHVADSMGRLDLLVTDVVMPGMNGVQLAAHLTKTRPDLPILYASGYSDEGVPKGAGQGDRISYLAKPFTAEALLTRIREVLDVTRPAASA
jgi:PAS domain S-box-containing protein